MEGICPSGDGDLPGAGKPFIASATSHGLPRSIDGAMARPLPPEAEVRDRRRAAVRVPRTPEAQAVPNAGPKPEGPNPQRGVRERDGREDGEDLEIEDRHGEGEPEQPALRHAEHHHPRRGDPHRGRPREGREPPRSGRRRERGPRRGAEGGGARPVEGESEARPRYSADLVIPTSRARAYGANVAQYTSPHHWTWSTCLLRPSTNFHTFRRLSVRRMSFHTPTTSPSLIRKIPSRGIVEKSPVT